MKRIFIFISINISKMKICLLSQTIEHRKPTICCVVNAGPGLEQAQKCAFM